MPHQNDNLAAIILCGGRSRRMGRDKAWVEIAGRPMLTTVVERVASAVPADRIVVSRHAEQELPPLDKGVRVAVDQAPDQGPMAGILAGFQTLPDDVELVFLLASDSPALEPALISHLQRQIGEAGAAVPKIGEQFYPLTALYKSKLARESAKSFYADGGRKVIDWMQRCDPIFVSEDELRRVDRNLASFVPCNSPEDLAMLQRQSSSD